MFHVRLLNVVSTASKVVKSNNHPRREERLLQVTLVDGIYILYLHLINQSEIRVLSLLQQVTRPFFEVYNGSTVNALQYISIKIIVDRKFHYRICGMSWCSRSRGFVPVWVSYLITLLVLVVMF